MLGGVRSPSDQLVTPFPILVGFWKCHVPLLLNRSRNNTTLQLFTVTLASVAYIIFICIASSYAPPEEYPQKLINPDQSGCIGIQ